MKSGRKSIWLWEKLNVFLRWLDQRTLWLLGFVLEAVAFAPLMILGEGCVIPIHDQLDETMLAYVLQARHLFDKGNLLPEMMGGINASGLQPSAVLFIPLYCILSPWHAFMVQYAVIFLTAFLGMYFCVKELTSGSILALAAAGCFAMLPYQPIYGLSIVGVPMLFYAFLCLVQNRRKAVSFLLILYFGLTTHLVLIGYVMLGFWLLYLIWLFLKKKKNPWPLWGFLLLLAVYLAVNHSLVSELLLGNAGYVSHREELVNGAVPFWETVKTIFLKGVDLHAVSLHGKLVVPILILTALEGIWYRRLSKAGRRLYQGALALFAVLAGIAVFYALWGCETVVAWRNSVSGFFHYFQANRVSWIYPAGWYLEIALLFGALWNCPDTAELPGRILKSELVRCAALGLVLLPTILEISKYSYFYMNLNQINNGSAVTGNISWESYYAKDLMEQLDETIGREKDSYRIAHLGISPTPSIMYGFYTVDGYSNNYPLEYKHRFRRVMEKELVKKEEARVYFDTWGCRCYLFNGLTGSYYMLGKASEIKYEGLEFDMEALRELGCEYLFSGAEILDAERMGLEPMGHFQTESSYWGIWLYKLRDSSASLRTPGKFRLTLAL